MKYRIEIPEPCHEDWDKMTPQDKGRHCDVCDKVVVDFSKYSKRDIINHIKKEGKICGRVPRQYVGVNLEEEKIRKSFGLNGMVVTAVNLLALTTSIQASTININEISLVQYIDQVGIRTQPIQGITSLIECSANDDVEMRKIKIHVVTESKQPIEGVAIVAEGINGTIMTDVNGYCELEVSEDRDFSGISLTFLKNELIVKKVSLTHDSSALEVVMLQRTFHVLGNITVTAEVNKKSVPLPLNLSKSIGIRLFSKKYKDISVTNTTLPTVLDSESSSHQEKGQSVFSMLSKPLFCETITFKNHL